MSKNENAHKQPNEQHETKGAGDQGHLERERRLQLRGGGLGGAVEADTVGGPGAAPGHLRPRRDSRGPSRDPRRRPRGHRGDDAGLLGPGPREAPDVSGRHGRLEKPGLLGAGRTVRIPRQFRPSGRMMETPRGD